MVATNPSFFLPQFLTDAGVIAAGYKLHTYSSGTTTNKQTFTDEAAAVPNSNPITLDSAGRCILFLGTGEYTFVLKDPADAATIWTRDNISGLPATSSSSFLPLTGGTMTGLIILSGNATSNLNPTPLQQVNALISSSTKPASSVSIDDAGGYYAGATVELALQEAGAFPGRLLRMVYFTASGTWTKGAGTTRIIVEIVGAGAGGRNIGGGFGGGGAGGYSRRLITAPGATETVTIGAGAAAAAGTSSGFGAWCSASGGALSAGTGNVVGGLGGIGSGGDLNISGGAGGYGGDWAAQSFYGHGGNSFFGGGAPGSILGYGFNTINGSVNTGGGGCGINSAGGSGLCIVYEFS